MPVPTVTYESVKKLLDEWTGPRTSAYYRLFDLLTTLPKEPSNPVPQGMTDEEWKAHEAALRWKDKSR